MSDAYWPWWAVFTFFGSGAFSAWLLTVACRPDHVDCPHCDLPIRSRDFRAHWKACLS
jgi:hypothetical protein